jgi:hypothetical protein
MRAAFAGMALVLLTCAHGANAADGPTACEPDSDDEPAPGAPPVPELAPKPTRERKEVDPEERDPEPPDDIYELDEPDDLEADPDLAEPEIDEAPTGTEEFDLEPLPEPEDPDEAG